MKSDILQHYGIKRRSGRYPWGSGENPYQHESWYFRQSVREYREGGLTDTQIASRMGMTTTEFRNKVTWANNEIRRIQTDYVKELVADGYSNSEIGRLLSISEGTVRNLRKDIRNPREDKLNNTVDILKAGVEKTGYLDVGFGVERQIGISQERLRAARQKMIEEGYYEHLIYLKNVTDPSKSTTIRVLTKEPDREVVKMNQHLIRDLEAYTSDNGLSYLNVRPPQNLDSSRILVRYIEDGGGDKDGLIELRRGVDDIDLGSSKYAQVRIAVDGTHYLKGMALYSDETFPKGIDVIYNVNKTKDVAKHDTFKKLKPNSDNPFGATIKVGAQRGVINAVNEEGDWNLWSSKFSSQMLSKQSLSLVQERLAETYSKIEKEYNDLTELTNNLVRVHLIQKFSDGLDAKASKLQAEGLARTKNHVLLPFPDMDPQTVYAPNYIHGEKVVLIRHPHGGIFEIPELTVDNKGPAKEVIGNAIDAIGIHPSVAKKLSGADFDGDTVLVIPNNQGKIKSARSLLALKNFEPTDYQVGYPTITEARKEIEMGLVSNLITDMTIKRGQSSDEVFLSEVARAVKHSMVVIDSVKHNLDYKKSEEENGIAALRKKYQQHVDPITGNVSRGASTIISKARSPIMVGQKVEKVINPLTGRVNTIKTGGERKTKMDYVKDAFLLSSGTPIEDAYASYANQLKALKNTAEKHILATPIPKKDPVAAKIYRTEVESLKNKLHISLLNAPRERQAQLAATKTYYKHKTPDMSRDDLKKLRSQALAGARAKHKPDPSLTNIFITPKEWEAIQAHAISPTMLTDILNNTDLNHIRDYATPKVTVKLPTTQAQRIRSYSERGYTTKEISDHMGVNIEVVKDVLQGQNREKGG